MKLKEIILEYSKETKVKMPFNRKQIEKEGYNMTIFLLELKKRLEKADDIRANNKTLKNFFIACEKLM